MKLLQTAKANSLTVTLLLGSLCVNPIAVAQPTDDKPKPDNSAVNKRDQNQAEKTADQQKMNPADREMTAKIRRMVMDDKALSTYAHNVKIISRNGVVTLKGPVRSDDEAKSIVAKATEVAGGADKVVNQISVQPASKQ